MNVTVCNTFGLNELAGHVPGLSAKSIVVITDSNVSPLLPGIISPGDPLLSAPTIVIPAGEQNKTIESAEYIWTEMLRLGMTRSSFVINVGGGMVTDIGGFAASTYRRGVKFAHVATTLLGAVDAAVGGKTGVNFGGLKNQIGVFAMPEHTCIPIAALKSLPHEELLSGYGEMLKTGYLFDKGLAGWIMEAAPQLDELVHNIPDAASRADDPSSLVSLIEECCRRKSLVVCRDPREAGMRKMLNFGHTCGHAFGAMTLARGNALPHGIAVAHGILVALILSHLRLALPSGEIYRYADFLKAVFPRIAVSCSDYPQLLKIMAGDKKNLNDGKVLFTLLQNIGKGVDYVSVEPHEIEAALDIYRDLTGQ